MCGHQLWHVALISRLEMSDKRAENRMKRSDDTVCGTSSHHKQVKSHQIWEKKNAVSLTEVIWGINRKTSSAWEGALLWSAWTAALDRWWTSWLTTWERERRRQREVVRAPSVSAQREKKSCTLAAVARVTISRQRRQTRRDKAKMFHLSDTRKLLKLCWCCHGGAVECLCWLADLV